MYQRNYTQEKISNKNYRETIFGRSKRLVNNAKHRAIKRSIVFDLTEDWVLNKLNLGVCELTNIPFDLTFSTTTKDNPFAPSLDRIDSSIGYTPENTRVILWCVNRALGQEGLNILKPVFKILAEL